MRGLPDVKYIPTAPRSAACYAIKEAVIAKEHAPEPLDTAIFFMDMRTFGKRLRTLFIPRQRRTRGAVHPFPHHSIDPLADGDLQVRYATKAAKKRPKPLI